MKTDVELKRDIVDALDWEPSVNAADVGVTVVNGIVTLKGSVAALAEKFAAEEAAKRVYGVKALVNDITVLPDESNKRTDGDIAQMVLNALDVHATVPDNRITVVVRDGWVTLGGKVDWQREKAAAEQAVRNLVAVKGVTNEIQIDAKGAAKDINVKIEEALKRCAEIDSRQVWVEVDGDKLILCGHVHAQSERDAVEHVAWAAPGISEIENNITVVP